MESARQTISLPDCSGDRAKSATHAAKDRARCGILGVPHAGPVRRLHMHAPERSKRNRTALGTHAVAIAPRRLGRFGERFVDGHSRAFRRIFCRSSALLQILRAHRTARPTYQTWRPRDRVSGSSVPRPARLDTRPQRASTRTGCRRFPMNDEVPSEILSMQQHNQRARNGTNKTSKDVQDSDVQAGGGVKALLIGLREAGGPG